jgi:hypothetical protein
MINEEVLNKIDAAVDFNTLRVDFPNIERVITMLDDGTQEVIFRMQGVDPDFHPETDYIAISNMTQIDNRNSIKTALNLRKQKEQDKRTRKERHLDAIAKRIKALITPAKISIREIIDALKKYLPTEEVI